MSAAMADTVCKWCGTWESCHGHDHLARECYPKQIEAKDSRIERMLALLKEIDATWPIATSELRERARKVIAEANGQTHDKT